MSDQKTIQIPAFSMGSVVYFKDARTSSRVKTGLVTKWKGYGWGILMGAIAPFGKDVDAITMIRAFGQIGYMAFDDIAEFLGDEAGALCLKKFEEKYMGAVQVQEVGPAPEGDQTGMTPPVEQVRSSPLILPPQERET